MDDEPDSPYAQIVCELQGDETHVQFAVKLDVVRSLVTDARKDKRMKSPGLLAALKREFPDDAARIQDAYNRSVPPPQPRAPRQGNTISQRQIQRLLDDGRLPEARQAVTLALGSGGNASERRWLYERLATACFGLGQDGDGLAALAAAIEAGVLVAPSDRKVVALRDELAGRYQRRDEFEAAYAVLDEGLQHRPTLPLLWRRKGVVHYFEHAYSNAYAALALALKHKQAPRSVIHVRGAVLAEWGNYKAAINDLDDVLRRGNPYGLNPVTLAHARSNRAYALAMSGKAKRALKEFAMAEKATPDNAWLHYLRALYYLHIDDTESGIAGLTEALTVHGRPLNLPKRLNAERLLRDLGVSVPSSER